MANLASITAKKNCSKFPEYLKRSNFKNNTVVSKSNNKLARIRKITQTVVILVKLIDHSLKLFIVNVLSDFFANSAETSETDFAG